MGLFMILNKYVCQTCFHLNGKPMMICFSKNVSKCPSTRSGHRIFATRDFIYLIGGYDPNISARFTFTDAWRFNLATEKWEKVIPAADPLPKWLASFSLVLTAVEGEVLIFGGTGVPFGETASNSLFRIKFETDGRYTVSLMKLSGGDLPKMYGQAMTYLRRYDPQNKTSHDIVHLIGGTTGREYNMDIWRIESMDSTRENWTSSFVSSTYDEDNEELQGRYRLEVVMTDDYIITFGGGNPDFCAGFENLLAFNLRSNEYVTLPTKADPEHGYPMSRKCHALVEFKGSAYLIGGCHDNLIVAPEEPAIMKKILNDIWCFDLKEFSWRKIPTKLSIPVFFHAAAITEEGCLYVFGGCTNQMSTERTNYLQRMWLRPPSLRYLTVRKACDRILVNSEKSNDERMDFNSNSTRFLASDVMAIVQNVIENQGKPAE